MCVVNIHLKDFSFPPSPIPSPLIFFPACLPPRLPVSQQYSVYPIIWAAGRGHADIVHLLLQNGAKVNCSDKVGQQDLSRFQSTSCPRSMSEYRFFHTLSWDCTDASSLCVYECVLYREGHHRRDPLHTLPSECPSVGFYFLHHFHHSLENR